MKHTKTKLIPECVLLLILAALLAWGTALERQQQRLSNGLIRLHVVAASNSPLDQKIKLRVRDAILSAAEPILESAENCDDAKTRLQSQLGVIEDAANETLQALGASDSASVSLQRELFGTRYYDTFTLPGGYYDALRVTIGAGEGKNWWCVVYPQICSSASAGPETTAVMGGLNEEDAELITEGKTRFRFRTLELFENLLGWFRGGKDGIPTSG